MSDQNQPQDPWQGMPYPPQGHPAWPHHPSQMQGYPYPPHPHHAMPPHGYHPHAGYHHAPHGYPPMPPHHYYGMPPHHPEHHESHPENDALFQQAQGMLEGMMGEQAGIFKDLMHKMGVDDKEFWKGAMIGAAAALVLSNENVRNNLLQMLTGAGDMLKAGGSKVKETTMNTAQNVSDNLNMGNEIFRDTLNASKQGFQDSVARHRDQQEPAQPEPDHE
ncbi:YtxH domain-containing protein [uncultured Photobacterium sp.]|uniref:YtxH domain-containing protein n=1 Tax=uncultured Photobacterium sp. TaxID=173973 RepID=UPI00261E8C22|nr:YtxH domain-containing protein [uncultured Photobacterium sp.]